jgi:hypothetical protein
MLQDAYGLKEKDAMSKFTTQAMTTLAKTDPMWASYTPGVRQQKIAAETRSLLLASPYAHMAAGIGLTSAPTNPGLVRTLTKGADE